MGIESGYGMFSQLIFDTASAPREKRSEKIFSRIAKGGSLTRLIEGLIRVIICPYSRSKYDGYH